MRVDSDCVGGWWIYRCKKPRLLARREDRHLLRVTDGMIMYDMILCVWGSLSSRGPWNVTACLDTIATAVV